MLSECEPKNLFLCTCSSFVHDNIKYSDSKSATVLFSYFSILCSRWCVCVRVVLPSNFLHCRKRISLSFDARIYVLLTLLNLFVRSTRGFTTLLFGNVPRSGWQLESNVVAKRRQSLSNESPNTHFPKPKNKRNRTQVKRKYERLESKYSNVFANRHASDTHWCGNTQEKK